MSDSTTNLDLVSPSQSSKETTVNAALDAASPSLLFGRRALTTAALTWGYFGGKYRKADGTVVEIVNNVLTLTASATNYILETDGVVSKVTAAPTGWPGPLSGGANALYAVVCDGSGVTSYTDYRTTGIGSGASSAATTAADVSIVDAGGYFTGTDVEAALQELGATVGGSGALADGDYGDVVVSGTGTVMTIDAGAVTYAKMQDISATKRVLGRNTAGAGDPEEVSLSQLLDWIGSAAQGDILYRDAAGWARLGAGTAGQVLKTQGGGAAPAWTDAPFDVSSFYPGVPSSSAKVMRVPIARAVTFAANFSGSYAKAGTAATGSTAFDVQKNGSTVGTITFAAAGTTATLTTSGGTSVSFAAGDVLAIIAPGTADATLADIGFALAGVRS